VISQQRNAGGFKVIMANLANSDPVLRHSARIALERLPIDVWRESVLKPADRASELYGEMALAHARNPNDVPALMERWFAIDPSRLNLSEKFVWVRLCELLLRTDGDVVQRRSAEVNRRLSSAWPDTSVLRVAPEGTTTELRQRIAQLLGRLESSDSVALVSRDLLHSPLQEDRLAGLLALRHQREGWTIAERRQQFRLLQNAAAMVGGQGMPTFLAGVKADSLATLAHSEKEALKELLEASADDASASKDDVEPLPSRPVVEKWQVSDLADLAQSNIAGNRERGAKIFREALCVRCHRMGSEGSAIGPDLTFVGRRFSARDLIDSIIVPSRSVAENFRLDLILTQAGTVYTGRILVEGDYRSEKLRIQTDALRASSVIEIDKREIDEHRQLERSPMPDGLLDGFTRDEIRDLLAFLQNP
jgi:putative heme-binding domain-containing protein